MAGWFQWYCRFFAGRRTADDARQVGRWAKVCGAKGRWKQNLVAKCLRAGRAFDDATVSPVVRQTLQHWAYVLHAKDFAQGARRVIRTGSAAYMPAAALQPVVAAYGKKK